jgi:hypothetical protein
MAHQWRSPIPTRPARGSLDFISPYRLFYKFRLQSHAPQYALLHVFSSMLLVLKERLARVAHLSFSSTNPRLASQGRRSIITRRSELEASRIRIDLAYEFS